jgi:integrase
MKRRGGGSIFRRGGSLWVKYYRDGQPIRESVAKTLSKLPGDVSEKDATSLLNRRLGDIARGTPVAVRAERVTVNELLDDLIREYTVNGRRSIERVQDAVDHLRAFFGPVLRAQTLTTATIREYIAHRQAATKTVDGTIVRGAANATINRELAALKRAFSLAVQERKILSRPHIPMLAENNVRQGFFEREQFEAVQRHLPEEIRPAATFAYITGWRRSEIIGLTWRQVDFAAGMVRLEPGTTKNRDGRTFPFTPQLRALLEVQRSATATAGAKLGRIIPYVFHRDGLPIKSFRRSWLSACKAAGVPGRIFHDFRRTAVRNLERAGVPRSVAMKMVGHKTEAVYRRYAIACDADLREAAARLANAAEVSQASVRIVTNSVNGRASDSA